MLWAWFTWLRPHAAIPFMSFYVPMIANCQLHILILQAVFMDVCTFTVLFLRWYSFRWFWSTCANKMLGAISSQNPSEKHRRCFIQGQPANLMRPFTDAGDAHHEGRQKRNGLFANRKFETPPKTSKSDNRCLNWLESSLNEAWKDVRSIMKLEIFADLWQMDGFWFLKYQPHFKWAVGYLPGHLQMPAPLFQPDLTYTRCGRRIPGGQSCRFGVVELSECPR